MAFTDPGTKLKRMHLLGPLVQEIATLTGENRERLMALLWRESWCTFAPPYAPKGDMVGWGDNNNGFGPFQIDRRYHADFIIKELGRYSWALKFGLPYRADRQGLYACGLLRQAREHIKQSSALAGDALERAVYASYNAGPARVLKAVQTMARAPMDQVLGAAIDSVTTGKDYSGYIFALADVLQKPKYQWIWS